MRRLADPAGRNRRRRKSEKQRVKAGLPHRVEYFHQVDDPYSHLAAQLLQPLLDTYDIELHTHLVSGPRGDNAPEPELLLQYARYDCAVVAPHYNLEFPEVAQAPSIELSRKAAGILAASDPAAFPQLAVTVGAALWAGDVKQMHELGRRVGLASEEETAQTVARGNQRLSDLGHYSGAMFHYGEEWYWGVDRLYHLENRLAELRARRTSGRQLLLPRPGVEHGSLTDDGSLTLEIYPSLRSPYTSIIFDRAVEVARAMKVKLDIKPVLPMVMRGAPVTRQKGLYIMSDTAREGETLGLRWGRACDPIGEPVRRAYSLYPWAREQGRGIALLSSFLQAAFFDGVNTNSTAGMRQVVKNAGLDWEHASRIIGKPGWEEELEANRLRMYEFGLWGVPSFRVLDEEGRVLLACWGQDRLWLVARVLQDAIRQREEARWL
jgi:2-hydroxychromene-2-carboxylate isomerase